MYPLDLPFSNVGPENICILMFWYVQHMFVFIRTLSYAPVAFFPPSQQQSNTISFHYTQIYIVHFMVVLYSSMCILQIKMYLPISNMHMHNYSHIIFVFFLKENKMALFVSGLLRQVLTVQIGLECKAVFSPISQILESSVCTTILGSLCVLVQCTQGSLDLNSSQCSMQQPPAAILNCEFIK